jgi:hypothetical protein
MIANRLLRAALFLTATLVPAAAAAQPSDADRATARILAQEGRDALKSKDYAVAADRFTRADAMVHAPTLLLDLARARAGLGQLIAAQEVYSRILREGVPPGSPPVFQKALDTARDELDALTPRIPSVTIDVKGTVSAVVTLDAAPLPAAALGVKRAVDPGKHVVRAQAGGFVPAEATFTVAEGKTESITLTLVPEAAPAVVPPPPKPVPVAPPPPPPVAPVVLGPPPPRPAPPPEAQAHRHPRAAAGIVALGVGGAGLVLGGVTGALFLARRSDLQAGGCQNGLCPVSEQGTLSDYRLYGTLSTVGFGVAAVGVVSGAVLLLTAPKVKVTVTGSTTITPAFGPGYLGVRGGF